MALGPVAIRFERRLPASPESLWDYLAHSDRRSGWLASGSCEPWIGGRVELRFRHPEFAPLVAATSASAGEATLDGRVTRCDPPHHLAFTWDEEGEVAFDLAASGDEAILVVTQHGLPQGATLAEVASGWHVHLDALGERVAGREPDAPATAYERLRVRYRRRFARGPAGVSF